MKTKHVILGIFTVIVSWMIELQFNTGYSNENGAPSAVTGSPGDGNKTCARSGCHTGFPVVNVPNLITSNIPASGYVPGTTYTITSTCTQTGINKWGFEISPQDTSGNLMGQIIVTNTSLTKIKSTKYITQTTSGSSGSGTKTWSFNWVAPASGSGDVTFYGSFNYANNNGGDSGDHIKTSTLLVQENTGTTGISNENVRKPQIDIWPNPVAGHINIKFEMVNSGFLKIALMGIDRKPIEILTEEKVSAGIYNKQFELNTGLAAGIYFVAIRIDDTVLVKKITVL